jgi:hypothetical protein
MSLVGVEIRHAGEHAGKRDLPRLQLCPVILIAMARSAGKTKTVALSGRKQVGTSRKIPRIARVAQRLGRMIPEGELRQFPKDLSSQVDYYVYGTPKR